MQFPVWLRRLAFRSAHRVLRVWWFFRRPTMRGVKCVITDGENVLLVRHTYGNREWDLPGGGIKRNESPVSAARREMEEELGVRIEEWDSLGQTSARMYHHRDSLHCFRAELSSPELQIDLGELQTANWFPRRQLPDRVGRHVRSLVARTLELDPGPERYLSRPRGIASR